MVELKYKRGAVSATRLQQEVEKIWRELAESSEMQAEAQAAGADLDELNLDAEVPVQIRPSASGLTMGEAIIVGLTVQAVAGIWRKYIWPEVEKRLGEDALGDEQKDDEKKKDE